MTRTSSTPRYTSLDHWRGVACLLVIVYHSTMVYLATVPKTVTAGAIDAALRFTHYFNVGVALFFVISGYCIAAAADNTRLKNGGVATYFVRRFKRIYPPFWAVVIFSIAVFFLLDYGWRAPLLSPSPWPQYRPSWYLPSQWVGNLTLTETWRYHLFGGIRGHFPGQAWTLCYEEQFYFVTGMVLLGCGRWFFPGIATVTVATIAVGMWAGATDPSIVDGFFFDGSWLLFAAGVAVYYRIRYASGVRRYVLDALLIAAVPASLWLAVPIYGAIVGFAFAALLPWLYRFDNQIASAALARPLLFCGRMCYSLYLVHQIPVKAVSAALFRVGVTGPWATLIMVIPASIAVSITLGWMFHIAVERRFLNAPVGIPTTTRELATNPAGAAAVITASALPDVL